MILNVPGRHCVSFLFRYYPGDVLGEVYSEISEDIEDIPESSRSV